MKKFCFVPIVIVMALCSSCIIFPIMGNGEMESSEKTVSSFEKIHSGGSADIKYLISPEYKVNITADSNLIDFVTAEVKNKTLYLGLKSGSYSFTKLQINVYCPDLIGIDISGSGMFSADETIVAPEFDVEISGSGKVTGTFECDKLSADISGSGKITVSGTGEDLNITITGSGKFTGDNFIVNDAVVKISGSGKANIHATYSLKVNISGSGELNYHGSPQTNFNISGSGRISKI